MKITVFLICVGKIRESYLKEGIAEYQKRLSRFCHLSIIETEEEVIPEICKEKDCIRILDREAEAIKKRIPSPSLLLSLDIEGKNFSSEEWADWLYQFSAHASKPLVFLIGGSLGLSKELRKSSDFRISLSSMTFPHGLCRLIFLEQLFRAFKLMHKEKYHK
ncbi:MAG TPA: 23S rRNA (pseudouridine(1915)-N(3))-methyltransferase RlmH [Caldisericia bacterium]|nr:23S rRNA (pseudouridine(1915)-N(3))-methyltransferase RlmH [Caldisericia bacterium]